MSTSVLGLHDLRTCLKSAAPIRSTARLQPAGGGGGKVFPPTYKDSVYAVEIRRHPDSGEQVPCVLIDSVQSQANRAERALLEAHDAGRIALPLISVQFPADLVAGGRLTVLELPHRAADAILGDSQLNGTPWRESEPGRACLSARPADAAGLFRYCPMALVFGMWDSTGVSGGSGAKHQRILTSELVAVDAREGVKTASRIDPLGILLDAGPLFAAPDGGWTLDQAAAVKDANGEPMRFARRGTKPADQGKPSVANHGNVTPGLVLSSAERGAPPAPVAGGVTCAYVHQSAVISTAAVRRVAFPDETGRRDSERDEAGRAAVLALALAATVLAREQGFSLRSRCDLVPETLPYSYETVASGSEARGYTLEPDDACALLHEAVAEARRHGLEWAGSIELEPRADLVELVRRSRAIDAGEEAA